VHPRIEQWTTWCLALPGDLESEGAAHHVEEVHAVHGSPGPESSHGIVTHDIAQPGGSVSGSTLKERDAGSLTVLRQQELLEGKLRSIEERIATLRQAERRLRAKVEGPGT
jgi:hypothetical protein